MEKARTNRKAESKSSKEKKGAEAASNWHRPSTRSAQEKKTREKAGDGVSEGGAGSEPPINVGTGGTAVQAGAGSHSPPTESRNENR